MSRRRILRTVMLVSALLFATSTRASDFQCRVSIDASKAYGTHTHVSRIAVLYHFEDGTREFQQIDRYPRERTYLGPSVGLRNLTRATVFSKAENRIAKRVSVVVVLNYYDGPNPRKDSWDVWESDLREYDRDSVALYHDAIAPKGEGWLNVPIEISTGYVVSSEKLRNAKSKAEKRAAQLILRTLDAKTKSWIYVEGKLVKDFDAFIKDLRKPKEQ